MNIERKRLLQEKLAKNRKMQENKRLERQQKEVVSELEDFDKRYRFANEAEIEKLESFIDKLQFVSPAHIKIAEEVHTIHNKMYLCFLCGTEELLKIYIYGGYKDFIDDYAKWDYFSPYLLLIDEDFNHYIYIDDSGETKESKI